MELTRYVKEHPKGYDQTDFHFIRRLILIRHDRLGWVSLISQYDNSYRHVAHFSQNVKPNGCTQE